MAVVGGGLMTGDMHLGEPAADGIILKWIEGLLNQIDPPEKVSACEKHCLVGAHGIKLMRYGSEGEGTFDLDSTGELQYY